jgi:hypothetical protein
MNEYSSYAPHPNKFLQPDGSITTSDGTVIEEGSAVGQQAYNAMSPLPNKVINPDGSISVFPQNGGGGFVPNQIPGFQLGVNKYLSYDANGAAIWVDVL